MKKTLKKCFFIFISLNLLFQSIYPPIALAKQLDSPEPSVTVTPSPTPEPPETPLPSETPTPSPTPELIPSPSVEPDQTLQENTQDEATPAATPEVAEISPWTFTGLTLNSTYSAPQNDKVKITFTKLPESSGNLLIKEVKLTPEQVESLGAVTDTAYDITSDMENGSFEYDLELPIPKTEDNLDVEYTESVDALGETAELTQEKKITEDTIIIKGLNHFTLFVVVVNDEPPPAAKLEGVINNGDSEYSEIGAWSNAGSCSPNAYNSDGRYATNTGGIKTATWQFTVPVTGYYSVDFSWIKYSTRATNAKYAITHADGVSEKIIDQRLGSNCDWSGLISQGNYRFSQGVTYSVVLSNEGADGIVFADAIRVLSVDSPQEVWVDDDYAEGGPNDGHYFGYDAFSDLQEAVNSVSSDGVVNVAPGEYSGNINIPSDLSDVDIIGQAGAILTGTFSNSNNSDITISGFDIRGDDIYEGANLSDLADSTVSDNVFTDQDNATMVLQGDLTGTEIKYNDFYLNSEYLITSLTAPLSLAFNYWGTGARPDSQYITNIGNEEDENNFDVDTNLWLLASKDKGDVLESGYNYQSDDEKLTITQGGESTATIYVAEYDSAPFGGLSGNLAAVGSYYDVVSENGDVNYPLRIEVKYSTPLPAGIVESELKGIYYHDDSGWHLYSDTGVDKTNKIVWANVDHLTPIVAGAEQDTSAPDVQINSPTASSQLKGTIDIYGSVTDTNPHHYYLVVKNSLGQAIAGPGTVNRSDSFTNQKLFTWNTTSFADGTYTIELAARDDANNRDSGSATIVQVIVDNTPPGNPVLKQPSNDAFVKGNPTQSWYPVSGTHHYVYESYSDPEAEHKIYTDPDLTKTSRTVGGYQTITFYWRVRAVDAVGNEGGWSNLWKLNVDNTAPTATVSYSTELPTNDQVVASLNPSETVTVTSAGGSLDHIFTENGSYTYTFVDRAGNSGSVVATVINIDTTPPDLKDKTSFSGWHTEPQESQFIYEDINGISSGGNVNCQITTQGEDQTCSVTPNVCDTVGNCNTAQVTSNPADIDLTDPKSFITTPINGGTGTVTYSNSWDGLIAGTATDNLSGVANVDLVIKRSVDNKYWDGSLWVEVVGEEAEPRVRVSGTTSWSYTLTSVSETSYDIVSHATDVAGNVENSYKLTIVYDKTIPEVSITVNPADPDSGNGWYKTQPEITLDATDDNKDKVEYQWDGEVIGKWQDYSVPFKPETEGAHTLYYRAVDKAGNYSVAGIKNLRWDETDLSKGPQNMNISPNPTSGTDALVKWEHAEDTVGIDHYEIRWQLVGGSVSYTTGVDSHTFRYTIDRLTEGKWEVTVDALDGAGNRQGVSQTLVVDRTAPTPPTLTLVGTGSGTATLSWNEVEDATDYIVWYGSLPGERLFGTRTGDTTSFTVRGLGTGSYYFIVKSVDSAQNQSSESNEVNTGAIAGTPGVEPGQPAQGFTPEVQGANTDVIPSTTPTQEVTPAVLGESTRKSWFSWQWFLLLLPLPFTFFFFGRKHRP